MNSSNNVLAFCTAAIFALFASGCSEPGLEVIDFSELGDNDTAETKDSGILLSAFVDSETGSDKDSDSATDSAGAFESCEQELLVLDSSPVAVMILQDMSGSMYGSRWDTVRPSLELLLAEHADSNYLFGLDMFPNDGSCGVSDPLVVDIDTGATNAALIKNMLPDLPDPSGDTPLWIAMSNFLDVNYAPGFFMDGHRRLLLVVSDGGDTCSMGHSFTYLTEDLLEAGVQTATIGFGDGVDVTQLNEIAIAGGTSFNSFLPAGDQVTLQAAFDDIAEAVVACSYRVSAPGPDADPSDARFFVDERNVPYDRGCSAGAGWNWETFSNDRVQFCGDTCFEIRKNNPHIEVKWGCVGDSQNSK